MKKMVDAQEGFELMKENFRPEVAEDFKKRVIVQYNVEGDGGGTWQVIFDNGEMEIVEGEQENRHRYASILSDGKFRIQQGIHEVLRSLRCIRESDAHNGKPG